MAGSVLIITDSRGHKATDSHFPVARGVTTLVDSVYILDRGDPENADFFNRQDNAPIAARKIDQNYNLDTAPSYPLEWITPSDIDTISIRLERPVSNDFLAYLGDVFSASRFVNDPVGLIKTRDKDFLVELKDILGDFIPGIALCRSLADVQDFKSTYGPTVLKVLSSHGGKGVFRVGVQVEDDIEEADIQALIDEQGGILVMEYLSPPTGQSDKRIIVCEGEIWGAIERCPPEGEWICNRAFGAVFKATDITEREQKIVDLLAPVLQGHGIRFYGIDTLVNSHGTRVLSEINALNVGLLAVIDEETGNDVCDRLAQYIAGEAL